MRVDKQVSSKLFPSVHRVGSVPVALMGGSSAPTIHFYADSVGGSDANDGLTDATAFQTLSALRTAILTRGDGTNVSLARGSYWEEFFDLDGLNNISVYAYDTGDPPIVSGAIPIPSGSFTLSAHADAAGKVYEYAWTRGSGDTAGQDLVLVWEGDYERSVTGGSGSGTSQNRLIRRTTVAQVAANPGSYYAPSENGGSSTIYIHPYGTTNPISDGKTYYVTKHSAGIDSYDTAKTAGTVEGIYCRRSWGHYGPLQWGLSGIVRKVIANGGGLHHTVIAASEASDVIMLDHPKNYGQSNIPYTAYVDNGSGLSHTASRVFVIGDDKTNQNISGFLSHGSTSPFDNVTFEECASISTAGGTSASAAENYTVNGCYFSNVTNCIGISAGTTATAEMCICKDVTTYAASDLGPVDTTSRNRIVRNCVFRGGATSALIAVTPRNGSLTIENCLIIVDGAANGYAVTGVAATSLNITFRNNIIIFTGAPTLANMIDFTPGTGTFTSNNNVFAYPGGAGAFNLRYRLSGSAVQQLVNWRTLSGQDANSLSVSGTTAATFLNAFFLNGSAGIDAGDYRINPSSGYTLVDGTNVNTCGPQYHWDWNARAQASGPPQAFPAIPSTVADAKTYIADPEAWDFYA